MIFAVSWSQYSEWTVGSLQHNPVMAPTSQFSVLIGQKLQLISWDNCNDVLNATCVDTQILLRGPTVHSLYYDTNFNFGK